MKKEEDKLKELKQTIKIFTMLTLVILFMTGAWMIDIGCSVITLNAGGGNVYAQSLLVQMDGNTVYHLGLILCLLSFYLLASLFVFEVINANN